MDPGSVKYQWGREIERFTDESYVVIGGTKAKRLNSTSRPPASRSSTTSYSCATSTIHELNADLVILDEAQRIKNWRAKTSQALKELPHPFAFVLSGTPLENSLEELSP